MDNVENLPVVEMSMRITKASYNKSEKTPMRWAAIDSDTDEDLYQERMSLELYQDFEKRIKNDTPIPEIFKDAICEDAWCGGMPYLSIAHYKSGSGKVNVPGEVETIFIDGTRLKSRGTLRDDQMGRKVFDALREDLYMEKGGNGEHRPVRISIGFLDLEHVHRSVETGTQFTFVRDEYGKICPLCAQGIGGKIYTKGHLIHLALTRVPANPRTQMSVEKSMDDITSKRQDAESIIGDLADGLEEKSISSDILVVRSEDLEQKVWKVKDAFYAKYSAPKAPDMYVYAVMDDSVIIQKDSELFKAKYTIDGESISFDNEKSWEPVKMGFVPRSLFLWKDTSKETGTETKSCYDPNTNSYIQECVDAVMEEYVGKSRDEAAVKSFYDVVQKSLTKIYTPTEEEMAKEKSQVQEIAPAPVEKEVEVVKAVKEEDVEDEDTEEKSALDATFEQLKSALQAGKPVKEVQDLFNKVGKEVEKSYVAPAPTVGDIAEIVKSAIAEAMQPLAVELATLKAQIKSAPVERGVVTSKAITAGGLKPEDLILRATGPSATGKKLTQIEKLAYKSTGALKE